ncbi:uncharacterized protein [Ranitomeya imitator]|uniref:uncharacterized protein n=1 Tax=Ranitomeya imitator TaxID=111125 RepID=UPI0037E76A4C
MRLEDRNRRNNIRIRGLPESVSPSVLDATVQKLFLEILNDKKEGSIEFDRIHRSLGPKLSSELKPRDVICRIHYYKVKESIMIAARQKEILDSVIDMEGRFIFLKLAWRSRELILANVYFPNQDQQKFGYSCKKLLEKFAGGSPIILGDFNLPMNPLVDVSTDYSYGPTRLLFLQTQDNDYKICMVRDIPCIWDAADVSYKDKYFRDHCWTKIVRDLYPEWDSLSIANQLEIEKNVKQRWRSVRDRYNKFINTCDRSGSSPSRITFPFYDELQFLLTSRTLRRTEGNLSNPPPVDDHSEDGAGTDGAGTSSGAGGTISPSLTTASAEAACPAAAAGTSTAAAVGSSGSSEAVVTEKRAPYPVAGESIKKKKKNDKTEKMASDTLDLLKQSSSEDQCDFFALTIARKARSLPPDRQSLFMSLCQTSLTALEDPAPIESYENVLTGVFGLFRPRPKPSEPHYRASSYTQPAQNFSGGGNTSLGPSASQSFMTDTSSSYGCSQEYTYLH